MIETTRRGQQAVRPTPRHRRLALALALACGALPAAAQDPDILSVVGQPVLALAQRPELTTGMRFTSGGHRGALAARLRDPGPPVTQVAEHFLQGWACRPSGCRDGGVFLAYDRRDERIYLMLTENGAVRLSVPPDPRGWPAALRAGVADFIPALAEVIGTRP